MKIKLRIMLSALLLTGASMTFADDKSALKVLYVGKNPEKVTFDNLMAYDKQSPFARRKVVLGKSRLPSFKAFLSKHFESVDVVYSADYSESMSDNYQVTIFGNVPRAVKEKVLEMDEKTGKVKRFEPPEYLSRDFDNAAILLAEVSPLIAEPLEYKMDWFCQCLDAHAHGMKLDHPIFNTPTRVALSVASRPTPESYRHYYNGRALPDALPMWRVQNEGYMDGKGYTIGMVSTGNGFADAPDAE
ncbi:MAG: hypothetical protein OIF34_14130, partial [Porticoccaceae bacterium]|nr:hypothetical protein [Porticoccaceae bacterium]